MADDSKDWKIALQNHLLTDARKVHGIMDLCRELIDEKIAAALAALVYDKLGGAYLTNPLIQCGREGEVTSVTFPVAYKSGTEPKVVVTSMVASVVIRINGNAEYDHFHVAGKGVDGSTQTQPFEWIAIGEKA